MLVYKDAYEACNDSSAVLILTEWDQFRYPPLQSKESVFTKSSSRTASQMFANHIPSELDILHMMTSAQQTKISSSTDLRAPLDTDPLNRYKPEPACADGCRDCKRGSGQEVIANENIEWARIAYQMRKPKWVFDGRGLVDVEGMEKLGFRVEVIGKAGSRSRLHGRFSSRLLDLYWQFEHILTHCRIRW